LDLEASGKAEAAMGEEELELTEADFMDEVAWRGVSKDSLKKKGKASGVRQNYKNDWIPYEVIVLVSCKHVQSFCMEHFGDGRFSLKLIKGHFFNFMTAKLFWCNNFGFCKY
jgi:hypothetical protein